MKFDVTEIADAWIEVALVTTGWDSRIAALRRYTFESRLRTGSAD